MADSTAEKIWAMIMDKFETLEDGQMLEINLNVPDEERKAFEEEKRRSHE